MPTGRTGQEQGRLAKRCALPCPAHLLSLLPRRLLPALRQCLGVLRLPLGQARQAGHTLRFPLLALRCGGSLTACGGPRVLCCQTLAHDAPILLCTLPAQLRL